MLEAFLQALLDWAVGLVNGAASVLPDCPFATIDLSGFVSVMGYINYFIPVGRMFTTISLWAAALMAYYIVQWGLRWAKMIE